jgi:hypothetical protein
MALQRIETVGGTANPIRFNGNIQPQANANVYLGNLTYRFATIYGISNQALYADLAENYQADAPYPPGTVLAFGGAHEVTLAEDGTRAVAGIVSTNPAYLMNDSLAGPNVVSLALLGRVPCRVRGNIKKGDLLVSAGGGFARPENQPIVGSVVGKALQDFDGVEGIIEVVVGKN